MRIARPLTWLLPAAVAALGFLFVDSIHPQVIDDSAAGSLAYLEPFGVESRRGRPWIFPGTVIIPDSIAMELDDTQVLVDPEQRALVQPMNPGAEPLIQPNAPLVFIERGLRTPPPATVAPTSPSANAGGGSRANNGVTSSGKFRLGQAIDKVRVTHYCSCGKCNGYSNIGISATGKKLTEGMCALDWLPFGSLVLIDNKYFIVEDRGVHEGQIDIYVDGGHRVALDRGKHYSTLRIVRIGRNGPMWERASISRHPLDNLAPKSKTRSNYAPVAEEPVFESESIQTAAPASDGANTLPNAAEPTLAPYVPDPQGHVDNLYNH